MLSGAAIRATSDSAARRAAHSLQQPYVYWDADEAGSREAGKAIPQLGDYQPKGWDEKDELFVDSSGFGVAGEIALSQDQFIDEVKRLIEHYAKQDTRVGFGIGDVGQFQLYVRVFTQPYTR